jgi:hypothetical protein
MRIHSSTVTRWGPGTRVGPGTLCIWLPGSPGAGIRCGLRTATLPRYTLIMADLSASKFKRKTVPRTPTMALSVST